jgi:hypothetical protein
VSLVATLCSVQGSRSVSRTSCLASSPALDLRADISINTWMAIVLVLIVLCLVAVLFAKSSQPHRRLTQILRTCVPARQPPGRLRRRPAGKRPGTPPASRQRSQQSRRSSLTHSEKSRPRRKRPNADFRVAG